MYVAEVSFTMTTAKANYLYMCMDCVKVLLIIIFLSWTSSLLTCGSDGDVRIYKDFDDSDPESVRVGDNVTVLAVKVSINCVYCKCITSA